MRESDSGRRATLAVTASPSVVSAARTIKPVRSSVPLTRSSRGIRSLHRRPCRSRRLRPCHTPPDRVTEPSDALATTTPPLAATVGVGGHVLGAAQDTVLRQAGRDRADGVGPPPLGPGPGHARPLSMIPLWVGEQKAIQSAKNRVADILRPHGRRPLTDPCAHNLRRIWHQRLRDKPLMHPTIPATSLRSSDCHKRIRPF